MKSNDAERAFKAARPLVSGRGEGNAARTGVARRVRAPQDAISGVAVIALAAFVLIALSRVRDAAYSTVSPTLFPRVCAWAAIAGGVALIVRSFFRDGPTLEHLPLRPVLLVTLAVVAFGLVAPVAGYAPAGLLTLLVGGLAAPDLRLRDLVVMSIGLIVFSVALFSYALKLTMPIIILPGLSF